MCPDLEKDTPEQAAEHCWPVALAEGEAFELNNNLPHMVHNDGASARVHLILDAGAVPHNYTSLKAGQACRYDPPNVFC